MARVSVLPMNCDCAMSFKEFLRVDKSTERLTDSTGGRKLEMTLRGPLFLSGAGPSKEAKPWQPQRIPKLLRAEKRLSRVLCKDRFQSLCLSL